MSTSLIFSILSLCAIVGTCHGLIKMSPEGSVDVIEGGSIDVCVEINGSANYSFPLTISITFEFFTAASTDILPSHPMELKLVQSKRQQCVEIVALPNLSSSGIEKIFAITVSVLDLQALFQCNVTIHRDIQLLVPATVEVEEGSTAVLCIEVIFPSTSLTQQVMVKLRLQDISTTLEDFNHSSVPQSLLLAADRPSHCLHIPTYSNEDNPRVSAAIFEISVTPGEHRVVVTVLEQGHINQSPTRVRRQDNTPLECMRSDLRPFIIGVIAEGFGILEVDDFPVDLNTFTILEASVVCKELGLGSAGFPLSARDLGVALFSQLHNVRGGLAQVQCSGNEACIKQCNVTFIDDEKPRDLAGIKCTSAVQCTDGAVRLVPPAHLAEQVPVREGRLEMCFHGVWGAVFDTDWSARDALTTCRQLGFNSNAKGVVPVVSAIYPEDKAPLPIVYDSPRCRGFAEPLLFCPREQPLCPDQEASNAPADLAGVLGKLTDPSAMLGTRAFPAVVGVTCPPHEEIPAPTTIIMEGSICGDLDVRLVSQERTTATGNLEVCSENRWLHACTNLLDDENLNVVCRSLGFTAYENSTTAHHRFVTPSISAAGQRQFIQPLNCSGLEKHLSQCDKIHAPNATCFSAVGIACLAPPRVTFSPSVDESGIFFVEENRSALLECIVERDSYPPVMSLTSLYESAGSDLSPDPYCLSATVYSTKRAAVDDSGEYGCVVTSGGLNFTHTVQLRVKTPADVGPVRVTDYLRFSTATSSPEQELEELIYSALSTNLPGLQEVLCRHVSRTPLDRKKERERLECAIITYASSSEDSVPHYLAAAVAMVLNRFHPDQLYSFNQSRSGFCDFEQSHYQDTDYSWAEAGAGTYSMPCPVAYSPRHLLTRTCNPARGGWLPVNTSQCKNALDTVQQVLDEQVEEESYEEQVELVAAVLQRTVSEESEQSSAVLDAVASFLDGVAEVAQASNQNIPMRVVEAMVDSLSSLQQWQPHLLNASSTSIARVTSSFEQSAVRFAGDLQSGSTVNISIPNQIVFAAEKVAVGPFQQTGRTYLVVNNTLVQITSPEDSTVDANGSIALPSSVFVSLNGVAQVGIIFTLYSTGALFPPRSADSAASTAVRATVVSPVVAATVGTGAPIRNIWPPVLVQFRLPPFHHSKMVKGSERCVWWDFTAVDGQGNWSTDGCTALPDHTDTDIVQCRCTHLTNFAILVDICARLEDCAVKESPVLTSVLSFITYIGASVSMLGLIFSIITMLAFRKLRTREASKYHLQLCVSLLCMLLVFVSGIEATGVYAGCVTVSALLHYFALTSLCWMAAEALFMCKKLTFVFKQNSSNFTVVVSLVCWGAPFVPVAIPLVVDLSQGSEPTNDLVIRRDEFCFLSNAMAFWAAFMGPILAILLINLVLYSVVVFILIRHTRGTMARRQEGLSVRTTLRLMASVISILFLFGLTWIFAVLTFTVPELHHTAQILFTIFNSLQGFFLFIFFCVLSLEARESWKECLSCGRYKSAVLRPHFRSNSLEPSGHNKLSISSDKVRIIRGFDTKLCRTSSPALSSAGQMSPCVSTPDLLVHSKLPVQATPQDDVATPTLTHGERQFITHTLSTPPQEENSHTLSTPPLQGENNHTLSAPPHQGENSHTQLSRGKIDEMSSPHSADMEAKGGIDEEAETGWCVVKSLGARVKRVSTMSHHVEEYQLDFLDTTDQDESKP